jgi:hypothetical protein
MNLPSQNNSSERSENPAGGEPRLALGDSRVLVPGSDVFDHQFQKVVGPELIQGVGQSASGTLFRREINCDNSSGFQLIEALHQEGVLYPRRLLQLVAH